MIRYSVETLWHFGCGECGKRWSVGGHQISNVRTHNEKIFCPHCGVEQSMEEDASQSNRDLEDAIHLMKYNLSIYDGLSENEMNALLNSVTLEDR